MSILIKSIEMPKGNDELRLIIHSNGQVIISHQTYYEETEAVPVPPHEDLIGRYAAIRSAFKGEQNIYCWDEIEEAIDSVPAIIESEE